MLKAFSPYSLLPIAEPGGWSVMADTLHSLDPDGEVVLIVDISQGEFWAIPSTKKKGKKGRKWKKEMERISWSPLLVRETEGEPAVEEPAAEEPAVEEPAVEEPAAEEPAAEEPAVEAAAPETTEEAAPEEAVPEEAVPEEAVLEEAVPEEAVPEEAVLEEAVTEEAAPAETVLEEAAPEEAAPEETSEVTPEEAPYEEPAAEEAVPEENMEEPAAEYVMEEPATEGALEPTTENNASAAEYPSPKEYHLVEEPAVNEKAHGESSYDTWGPKVRMRVSSSHLRLASPYFKRMFRSGWPEGDALRVEGRVEIRLRNGEDPDALLIILNIIHGHTRKVPRVVDLTMLTKIAVLVDFYECYEAVEIFSNMWIDSLKGDLPQSISTKLTQWIWVAWVFNKPQQFKAATRIAGRQNKGPIETDGLPIPQIVVGQYSPLNMYLKWKMC